MADLKGPELFAYEERQQVRRALAAARRSTEKEDGTMGFVNTDNSPVGEKTKVLQQAEDKLVKARDLLKRCRDALSSGPYHAEYGALYADITDFIGD